MPPLAYAGIGSRDTPDDVLALMEAIGRWLGCRGWTLRSGAAKGADSYFDQGARAVGGPHEIFMPEPNHKLHLRPGTENDPAYVVPEFDFGPVLWAEATRLAAQFHGGFAGLDEFSAKLITRNTFQILGADLASPADMVVCYGEGSKFDGKGAVRDVRGGTGQAVRLAYEYDIPVYNLALPRHRRVVEATIGYVPATPALTQPMAAALPQRPRRRP